MSARIKINHFTCFIAFLGAIVCFAMTGRTSNVSVSGATSVTSSKAKTQRQDLQSGFGRVTTSRRSKLLVA